MLTMYYQTSSAIYYETEKVIDFAAYLPEKPQLAPVCRPLIWDKAYPAHRRKRRAAALHHSAELGATLALLAAALTVPLCLFLL